MVPAHVTSPRPALPFLLVVLALLVGIGVVMADTHVPVPVPPDAVPAGGAQLATFALG